MVTPLAHRRLTVAAGLAPGQIAYLEDGRSPADLRSTSNCPVNVSRRGREVRRLGGRQRRSDRSNSSRTSVSSTISPGRCRPAWPCRAGRARCRPDPWSASPSRPPSSTVAEPVALPTLNVAIIALQRVGPVDRAVDQQLALLTGQGERDRLLAGSGQRVACRRSNCTRTSPPSPVPKAAWSFTADEPDQLVLTVQAVCGRLGARGGGRRRGRGRRRRLRRGRGRGLGVGVAARQEDQQYGCDGAGDSAHDGST